MNHDFVQKSELPVKIVICALIVLGIIVDVMVWRWRHLAKYIAYYELLFMMVHGFVPLNYGDFKNMVHLMAMTFSWFLYTCDLGSAAISYTIASLIILFLEFPLVYKETWSVSLVGEKIYYVVTLFLVLTLISMLVTYIA